MIVTTPNRDAYADDIVWDVETPPVHLWWLSEKSMYAIAKKIGCKLEIVDLASHPKAHLWEKRSPMDARKLLSFQN